MDCNLWNCEPNKPFPLQDALLVELACILLRSGTHILRVSSLSVVLQGSWSYSLGSLSFSGILPWRTCLSLRLSSYFSLLPAHKPWSLKSCFLVNNHSISYSVLAALWAMQQSLTLFGLVWLLLLSLSISNPIPGSSMANCTTHKVFPGLLLRVDFITEVLNLLVLGGTTSGPQNRNTDSTQGIYNKDPPKCIITKFAFWYWF